MGLNSTYLNAAVFWSDTVTVIINFFHLPPINYKLICVETEFSEHEAKISLKRNIEERIHKKAYL